MERVGLTPPRFYQTKPFVMLAKLHSYSSERMGYEDYRKMTNGFVFLGMTNGIVGRIEDSFAIELGDLETFGRIRVRGRETLARRRVDLREEGERPALDTSAATTGPNDGGQGADARCEAFMLSRILV